jgi:type II secretory pathway component PulK
MRITEKNNGMALLITVFVIALLSVLVMGMLQINTEETQLMQNQILAAKALTIAEAGLNDAFAQIRTSRDWSSGFSNKLFEGGSYTVTVTGTLPNRTIESTGTTSQGFVARLDADVTISSSSPYIIRIDSLRVNE